MLDTRFEVQVNAKGTNRTCLTALCLETGVWELCLPLEVHLISRPSMVVDNDFFRLALHRIDQDLSFTSLQSCHYRDPREHYISSFGHSIDGQPTLGC